MKKIFFLLTVLFLFPVSVFAKEYKINDLTMPVDTKTWSVITREDLTINEEVSQIDDFGVTSEELIDFMTDNNIYLDAIKLNEKEVDIVEMFIKIVPISVENVKNLHNYSNKDIKALQKELFSSYKPTTTKILSYNNYKWIYAEYEDIGYHIMQYITIINENYYSLLVQKVNKFTNDEKRSAVNQAKNISFKLDKKFEVAKKKNDSSVMWTSIIVAAITGVILSLGSAFKKSDKTKPEEKEKEIVSEVNSNENQIPFITNNNPQEDNKKED